MTWTEIKIDGYDFCTESGNYQVRRKGEQVELWYLGHRIGWYRIGWCGDIEDGMFEAWILELKKRRRK